MLVEGRLSAEALVTLVDLARVWPLIAVNFAVAGEARRVGETLVAHGALMWLLASVGPDVDCQGTGLYERLATVVVRTFVVACACVCVMMPYQV